MLRPAVLPEMHESTCRPHGEGDALRSPLQMVNSTAMSRARIFLSTGRHANWNFTIALRLVRPFRSVAGLGVHMPLSAEVCASRRLISSPSMCTRSCCTTWLTSAWSRACPHCLQVGILRVLVLLLHQWLHLT